MRRQFEGGDNKAQLTEASGDYLSAATIRGRHLKYGKPSTTFWEIKLNTSSNHAWTWRWRSIQAVNYIVIVLKLRSWTDQCFITLCIYYIKFTIHTYCRSHEASVQRTNLLIINQFKLSLYYFQWSICEMCVCVYVCVCVCERVSERDRES